MHNIEPFYNWLHLYKTENDLNSPLYSKYALRDVYTNTIYGYLIHPEWDEIGSETLYLKILYADYLESYVIIELFGEWNDCINNDIMFFKRKIIDKFIYTGIDKFIIIGENILNFHFLEDDYYEEWFQDVEDGWIAFINFRKHILDEFSKFNLDFYINYGGILDEFEWRKLSPKFLFKNVKDVLNHRLK